MTEKVWSFSIVPIVIMLLNVGNPLKTRNFHNSWNTIQMRKNKKTKHVLHSVTNLADGQIYANIILYSISNDGE